MIGIRRAGVALVVGALGLALVPVGVSGAQTKDPVTVKIGAIIPVDAPSASFKPNAEALDASVAGFNKRNKNLKFDLIHCDGKRDPNLDAECARKMVSEGVVATVGDIAAGNPTAVNQILADAGIPRVGLSMLSLPEFGSPVSYPLSSGPVLAAGGSAPVFADQGIKRLALLVMQSPQASATGALLKPALDAAGIQSVETVIIPEGTTDYSSSVSAAANAGDGIICVCTPDVGVPVAAAAAQLGLTTPLNLILLGFSQEQIAGTDYQDWVFVDSFPSPSKVNEKAFPGLKNFLADMKASKNKDLAPKKLTGSMVQGWLALQAITEVIQGSPQVTAATVKSGLDSATDIDMLGIIPPWTPSNPGPTALFSRVSNPYLYRIKWKNNNLVTTKNDPIDLTEIFN